MVIGTEIEIAASPDQVWAVLADPAGYQEWNPFVISMAGDLRPGERITIVTRDGGGKESTHHPEILVADPGRELRWVGSLGGGFVFRAEHWFQIVPDGPDRVRLVHGERFSGIAVPFLRRYLRTKVHPQFEAMNQALASRVAAS